MNLIFKTSSITKLSSCLILAWAGSFIAPIHAETASADTNLTTVDTRGGTTVRGQIVDGTPPTGPYLPLAGVTVSVGATNAVTAADGHFSLSANLTAPGTFQAAKELFAPLTASVQKPAQGDVVDLGLITLKPATDKPIVEMVKPDVDGIFIAGFGLVPQLKATVNWNENTPAHVTFKNNGKIIATVTGAGPDYVTTVDVDD